MLTDTESIIEFLFSCEQARQAAAKAPHTNKCFENNEN